MRLSLGNAYDVNALGQRLEQCIDGTAYPRLRSAVRTRQSSAKPSMSQDLVSNRSRASSLGQLEIAFSPL